MRAPISLLAAAWLCLAPPPLRAQSADPAASFGELPLGQAVRVEHGAAKRALVVFEDPYCPHCRNLHATLAQMKDVLVFTFLIDVLDADSGEQADRIWCAPDRALALERWFSQHASVPRDPGCHAPLVQTRALAGKLGLRGTPTILFADGSTSVGAIGQARLEQRLREAATGPASDDGGIRQP